MELVGEDSKYTAQEADGKCEDMSININSYMKDAANSVRAELRAKIAEYCNQEGTK